MVKWFKIFLLLVITTSFIFSQNHLLKFEHLTTDDGLSGSVVESIFQDSKGFMWFATRSGLNKYDGYNFTIYRHDNNDPNSIGATWVMEGIIEDLKGNLWLGTWGGGLSIFDREKEIFYNYKHDEKNPNSICDDNIMDIYKDRSGNLWLCTESGLSKIVDFEKYDIRENIPFVNYKHDPDNPHSLNNHFIYSVYQDSQGTLWIGTRSGGINILEKNSRKFLNKDNYRGEKYKILHHPEFSRGISWFKKYNSDPEHFVIAGATDHYICKINIKDGTLTDFSKQLSENYQIPIKNIGKYIECKNRQSFIHGLNKSVLYVINENKQKAFSLYPDARNPFSISNTIVESWYTDDNDITWIGTLGGGVNKYVKPKDNFAIVRINIDSTACSIHSIHEDCAENDTVLWLGTTNVGLTRYNKKNGEFKHFKNEGIPRAIYQFKSNPNIIWFGTIDNRLFSFNKEKEKISKQAYNLPKEISETYGIDIILSITGDDRGNLWIGSLAGLTKFNTKTKKFWHYNHDVNNPNSLSNNVINSLYFSTNNKKPILWVGTRYGGLNKFDITSETFTYYKNDPVDSLSIGGDYISCLSEDKSGNLWVGTAGGLQKFDPSNEKFIRYTDKYDLLNIDVMGILQENDSTFWLHTKRGICRFNIQNRNIRFFDRHDGLPAKDFNRYAYHEGKSGNFYFGINNNMLSFKPGNYNKNRNIPPVEITDFQIFNQSVKPGENSPLSKSISNTDTIILSYDQSVFSFEFTALDYFDPTKNKYAHKMEDVDPEWVYTDASRRFATYTNLDPGEYTFRVKGSNNDGIWNEEGTSIKIIITPPWWKTNLAYVINFVLIISIIVGAWRFQANRLKMKHQLEMEHFETEKLREVDKLKTQFFANISHEFRTPLTLIKGPAKQIMEGTFTGNLKKLGELILRNSDRLLELITQILDLSKLESGEMKLSVSETDIGQYVKNIVASFSSLAESRNISLKFKISKKLLVGYIDKDKLTKIIINLLSNAFKFTPQGGEVKVNMTPLSLPSSLTKSRQWTDSSTDEGGKRGVKISITNTGPGIPPNKLNKIFERFYQADDHSIEHIKGTGIGLSLTKELIEICRGDISVSSIPNQKTKFIVILPITRTIFKEDEIVDESEITETFSISDNVKSPLLDIHLSAEKTELSIDREYYPTSKKHKKQIVSRLSVPLVLIVEDNADVTGYITSGLEKDYRIITTENGKAGLKKILEKDPDLVISDVMMPEMDGFQLCRTMKSDQRISHIPLILLTARADMESKLEGLEFGADDYITKPFDARELAVRSKNLLDQRHRLREHFRSAVDFRVSDITVNSIDEQFMQKAIELIEKHIEDTDFSVEKFSLKIGISSRHLNRKLKAITNYSTRDFVRILRLKRAALLIKNNSDQITQIAYQVGFNNPSSFAGSFRKHFGMSPSEYGQKYSV